MNEQHEPQCPECRQPSALEMDRRDFMGVVGGTAAVAVASPGLALARAARLEKAIAAEVLIQTLHDDLNAEQKKQVVMPYDHGPKTVRQPAWGSTTPPR